MPKLVFVRFTSRNILLNSIDLALRATFVMAGLLWLSMCIRPSTVPPAMPRFIESRFSTPSRNRTFTAARSNGNQREFVTLAAL